jgi:hypothetical protein
MAPGCNLAEQALREFDAAIEILNKGTVGTGATRILVRLFSSITGTISDSLKKPALEKLQAKAHNSIQLHRSGLWKPDKKASPPPPEMPGLGTAMLPLASKSDQTPQSSPPTKSSPPSAPGARASIDLPSLHTPPTLQLRPVIVSRDVHMHEPGQGYVSSSISPQEIMHAATSQTFQVPLHFHEQTGRPCSRAQSFDDFLRLHRLQDRDNAAPILSAPQATTELPQVQQQPINGHPVLPQDAWEQNPFLHSFNSYDNVRNDLQEIMPTNTMDGVAQFGLGDGGEYDPDTYSDLSWQHFMNGLEL